MAFAAAFAAALAVIFTSVPAALAAGAVGIMALVAGGDE